MSKANSMIDVIVVGGGTAGLSAAKSLMSAGLSVVVVEADGHVGRRCITDCSAFDTPFDRGGSWLHSAEINPLAPLASENGFQLHKKAWNWRRVIAEGRSLTRAETEQYSRYQRDMWEQINLAGSTDQDMAIEGALPRSPWRDTAKHWVAQMLGGDCEVTSARDSAHYEEAAGDWLVSGGLGAFVSFLHRDVQVKLNCPVSKIDYSGPVVRATTTAGTIEARYLVLTVSTGVLAAEAIRFVPTLPGSKLNAIGQLPNGLLNKYGIEFDPAFQEMREGDTADYHATGKEFCTFLFGMYGSNLAVGFVAGQFADLLETEGKDALGEFCREGLQKLFGNNVTRYIRKTAETTWRGNRCTLGSYSYALPGSGPGVRETLARPLENKLFFAGEATMARAFATVHGAWLSGRRAADEIIALEG